MRPLILALALAACGPDLEPAPEVEVADAGFDERAEIERLDTRPCGKHSTPAACRASLDGGP